jgi:exonuclease III
VEPNPGPGLAKGDECNLAVVTFNSNGLGEASKLRRLLKKAHDYVSKGGIFLVQETHLINDDLVKMYWKGRYVMSNFKSNSAGVLTLYGNEYKTLFHYSDEVGRRTMTVIESDLIKALVVNIYVPNNHGEVISFMEKTYLKILEILNEYPDSNVILGGDMNVCMALV